MTTNLYNFTDVLGDVDEIFDSQVSQPLSLSPSTESRSQNVNECKTNYKPIRPAKGTGQFNELRSVEEIDPKYREIFSYPFFNIVQSRVIEDALYSDKSMVVCAPTGSGKTVVFEMAIVQLLMEIEDKNSIENYQIIYMAPVKALCTERLTEWYSKLNKLGLLCIEVTGDTDVDFTQLQAYKVIITTPEKWDILTRRWKDHRSLVEKIKLFLIDEVHILNEETRGPVLEAVVSRMKTIQTSAQSAHRIEKLQKQYKHLNESGVLDVVDEEEPPPRIRFVAVSATVSNPEDVAAWLGTHDKPAVYYKFGDECRPVKVERVVEGYPCADGTSIFKFDIILNYKLWPIIQKYHDGKPTLIFCNTRKSVILTAETLSREITITFSPEQQAKLTALASTIKNKKLQSLVLVGVGCHHAGLLYEERTNIEHAFRNGDLPILITTTTLAMGVNLPAHLVIIKNTQQYVKGAYQEYSISTVLQMMGRAGRPQYDTDATAVIMTRQKDKARYQALAGGSEPLQSYLHKRLAENLNSEAALGTVGDVAQCVEWLRSTFLYVRAAKDPKRYLALPATAPEQLILKKLEELCLIAMNGLSRAGLISMDEASCIESTEAGRLMSLYYLDLETMKHVMKIQGDESLERLVSIICECHELSDMHLRTDERRCLNALNRNNTAATIRFPLKGKITTRQMKLSCIIQAVLGCLPIPDPSLNQEAMKIMRIADRICKCLVAYVTRPVTISQQLQHFSAILNSIILAKCVAAHLWENSPYVSKQLKGIGPIFSTLLATAGKVNFMLLEESHPRDLERIMNKGAPAGNILRKQISLLPKYQLTTTPVDENTVSIKLFLLNQAFLSENLEHLTAGPTHKCYIVAGDSENHILLLSTFTDKDLIRVYNGSMDYNVTRKHNFEHKIFVHCLSSNFVGVDVQCEFTFTKLLHAVSSAVDRVHSICKVPSCNTRQTKHSGAPIPKTRKRNNTSEEITQSKEKKKRDNAFAEKIKYLKDSFSRSSSNQKKAIEEAQNIAKNMLNDFSYVEKTNNEERNTNIKYNDDMNCLDDELVDCIDDAKIDSILNEIESEINITKRATTNQPTVSNNVKTGFGTVLHAVSPSTNYLRNRQASSLRKTNNPIKSNYKFLDLLEKNIDLSDEDIEPKKDTGFNENIKSYVEKYIINTHKTAETVDLTVDNFFIKKPVPDPCGIEMNESKTVKHDGSSLIIANANTEFVDLADQNHEKSFQSEIHLIGDNNIFTCNDTYKNVELINDKQDNDIPYYTPNAKNVDHKNCGLAFKSATDVHNLKQNNCEENKFPTDESVEVARPIGHVNTKIDSVYKVSPNTECSFLKEDLPFVNLQSMAKVTLPKHQLNKITNEVTYLTSANKETPSNPSIVPGETVTDLPNQIVPFVQTIELSKYEDQLVRPKIALITPVRESSLENINEIRMSDLFYNNIPMFERNNMSVSSTLNIPKNIRLQSIAIPPTTQSRKSTSIISLTDAERRNNKLLANSHMDNSTQDTVSNFHLSENKYEAGCSDTCSDKKSNGSYSEKSTKTMTNNGNNKYEENFSFSTEKVDIQTTFTSDHKIHVIRRLKLDLDVRKIVSSIDRADSAKASNNTNEQLGYNENYALYSDLIIPDKNNKKFDKVDDKSEKELEKLPLNNCILPKCNYEQDDETVHLEVKSEESANIDDASGKQYNQQHMNTVTPEKEKLKNIFKKYSKIIETNKNSPASTTRPNSQNLYGKKITNLKPLQSNRPFKISDIHHLNVPLPYFNCDNIQPPINAHEQVPTLRKHQNPKSTNTNAERKFLYEITEDEISGNAIPVDTRENYNENVEVTRYRSPTPILENALEISENDLNIDQSMFNPKTLLQSIKHAQDNEIILPPPPEFGNNTDCPSYSPETSFASGDTETYFKINDYTVTAPERYEQTQCEVYENRIFDNIVGDTSQYMSHNISPVHDIETWNLSRDDEIQNHEQEFTTQRNSFTVLQRNQMMPQYNQSKCNFNDIYRPQNKLNVFKFRGKKKLKYENS